MTIRVGGSDVLNWVRPVYWSVRGQFRKRHLVFFVCERGLRPSLPVRQEIRCGGVGCEEVVARLAVLRGQDPGEYCARLSAGHWVVYAVGPDESPQSWGWVTVPMDAPQYAP